MLELSRALRLFSVHCNAKVDCVFELSKKKEEKKHTKKRRKKRREKKRISRDKKRKETKVRGK